MSEADPAANNSLALGLTVALLVLSNVMANLVLDGTWHVLWNLGVALALLAIAMGIGGLGTGDLGLAPNQLRSGLRWGGAIGGTVMAVVMIAALLPGSRDWFVDDLGRGSVGHLLVKVLVTIPLGTVVMEEIAFRACLPGLLDARPGSTARRTLLLSAAAFGMWHILPSRHLGERNKTMGSIFGDTLGRWAPVAAAVVATSVAGAAWLWLRRRSDSVIAPMLVHWSLNAVGTVAAWLATR